MFDDIYCLVFFFFQAEDGIRDHCVTGVQTCALPIYPVIPGVVRIASQTVSSRIILTRRYPGKIFSLTVAFLPPLTTTLSCVGTRSSNTFPTNPSVLTLWRRVSDTLASCPD